ncbi:hypothetical protein D3C79_823890 [compost metagenome]
MSIGPMSKLMASDNQAIKQVGVIAHNIVSEAVGEPQCRDTSDIRHLGKDCRVTVKIAFHVGLVV